MENGECGTEDVFTSFLRHSHFAIRHSSGEVARARLLAFEAALATLPNAVQGDSEQFPLVHRFAEGLYVREIFLPAGSILTGKIHKQAHPVFLMQGALLVYTESGGVQELHAPLAFIAPPGTKRAAVTLEDTVWITVHANPADLTDLAQIEADVIAPDFAAYDEWRAALEAGQPLPALPGAEEGDV